MYPILDSFILYFLTTRFGDEKDTSSEWKVFAIVILAFFLQFIVLHKYRGDEAQIAAVSVATLTVGLLLVLWCRMSWIAALKISTIFLVVRIAYGALIQVLQK
jgi:hypothetical protein